MREVLERLRPRLRTFGDDRGRELFDVPGALLPDPDIAAPVRFLPEYDNILLGHDDRGRIVSPGVSPWTEVGWGSVLVDGFGSARWKMERDRGPQPCWWNRSGSCPCRKGRGGRGGREAVDVPGPRRGLTGRARPPVPTRVTTRIGAKERRARLGVLHHLAGPAPSVEEAAASMVGLHSSDPASVYLSAWARVEGFEPADLEDALYHRRALVRMLGMRRTLFVVPVDLASIMHEACTKARVPAERRRLVRMLEEQGVVAAGRGERWLDRVASATFEALGARGEASARELTADVPELGTKLSFGQGTTWAATVGVSTRVLFLLATEGLIVRARPLGSWTSGQYRWTTIENWLGGSLVEIDHAEACAELLARYLRTFGPATMTDLRWWTGWSAKLSATTLGP